MPRQRSVAFPGAIAESTAIFADIPQTADALPGQPQPVALPEADVTFRSATSVCSSPATSVPQTRRSSLAPTIGPPDAAGPRWRWALAQPALVRRLSQLYAEVCAFHKAASVLERHPLADTVTSLKPSHTATSTTTSGSSAAAEGVAPCRCLCHTTGGRRASSTIAAAAANRAQSRGSRRSLREVGIVVNFARSPKAESVLGGAPAGARSGAFTPHAAHLNAGQSSVFSSGGFSRVASMTHRSVHRTMSGLSASGLEESASGRVPTISIRDAVFVSGGTSTPPSRHQSPRTEPLQHGSMNRNPLPATATTTAAGDCSSKVCCARRRRHVCPFSVLSLREPVRVQRGLYDTAKVDHLLVAVAEARRMVLSAFLSAQRAATIAAGALPPLRQRSLAHIAAEATAAQRRKSDRSSVPSLAPAEGLRAGNERFTAADTIYWVQRLCSVPVFRARSAAVSSPQAHPQQGGPSQHPLRASPKADSCRSGLKGPAPGTHSTIASPAELTIAVPIHRFEASRSNMETSNVLFSLDTPRGLGDRPLSFTHRSHRSADTVTDDTPPPSWPVVEHHTGFSVTWLDFLLLATVSDGAEMSQLVCDDGAEAAGEVDCVSLIEAYIARSPALAAAVASMRQFQEEGRGEDSHATATASPHGSDGWTPIHAFEQTTRSDIVAFPPLAASKSRSDMLKVRLAALKRHAPTAGFHRDLVTHSERTLRRLASVVAAALRDPAATGIAALVPHCPSTMAVEACTSIAEAAALLLCQVAKQKVCSTPFAANHGGGRAMVDLAWLSPSLEDVLPGAQKVCFVDDDAITAFWESVNRLATAPLPMGAFGSLSACRPSVVALLSSRSSVSKDVLACLRQQWETAVTTLDVEPVRALLLPEGSATARSKAPSFRSTRSLGASSPGPAAEVAGQLTRVSSTRSHGTQRGSVVHRLLPSLSSPHGGPSAATAATTTGSSKGLLAGPQGGAGRHKGVVPPLAPLVRPSTAAQHVAQDHAEGLDAIVCQLTDFVARGRSHTLRITAWGFWVRFFRTTKSFKRRFVYASVRGQIRNLLRRAYLLRWIAFVEARMLRREMVSLACGASIDDDRWLFVAARVRDMQGRSEAACTRRCFRQWMLFVGASGGSSCSTAPTPHVLAETSQLMRSILSPTDAGGRTDYVVPSTAATGTTGIVTSPLVTGRSVVDGARLSHPVALVLAAAEELERRVLDEARCSQFESIQFVLSTVSAAHRPLSGAVACPPALCFHRDSGGSGPLHGAELVVEESLQRVYCLQMEHRSRLRLLLTWFDNVEMVCGTEESNQQDTGLLTTVAVESQSSSVSSVDPSLLILRKNNSEREKSTPTVTDGTPGPHVPSASTANTSPQSQSSHATAHSVLQLRYHSGGRLHATSDSTDFTRSVSDVNGRVDSLIISAFRSPRPDSLMLPAFAGYAIHPIHSGAPTPVPSRSASPVASGDAATTPPSRSVARAAASGPSMLSNATHEPPSQLLASFLSHTASRFFTIVNVNNAPEDDSL